MPRKKRRASSTDPADTTQTKRRAGAKAKAVDAQESKKKDKSKANKNPKSKNQQVEDEELEASQKLSAETEPKQNQFKNEQFAKSSSLVVPLDEVAVSRLGPWYRVYIDPDGLIYDATLNQTNIGGDQNNNKFYRVQVLHNQTTNTFTTWTRWGRVGTAGQSKQLGSGSKESAITNFESKFREKSGLSWDDRLAEPKKGKYTFLEKAYESDSNGDNDGAEEIAPEQSRRSSKVSIGSSISSKSVESRLPEAVQRLMGLIFNQGNFNEALSAMDYDATKMPLGKLSKRTLQQGFSVLKDIADLVGDPSISTSRYGSTWNDAIADLSGRYWTLIPHVFGRRRPPSINNSDMIKKEVDLLDSLTDMQAATDIMRRAEKKQKEAERLNQLDRQFADLGLDEMTPLETSSAEFIGVYEYLNKSSGSTHNVKYQVQDIFRIERQGEASQFTNLAGNSDRRLLWHGSRATNFGGILSQGLRIAPPEAPVSGYMFGKGVYLADMSTKSANYCYSHASQNTGLLLLCEAELGTPMLELTNADFNAGERAVNGGCLSTWGKGNTGPTTWKDARCLNKNLRGVIMPDCDTIATGNLDGGYYSLLYNEYIVYDVKQIRLRYLLRVGMGYGY